MADANAVNTGKKSDVNAKLNHIFQKIIGHDNHILKCLFHVNEMLYIAAVEG